jgi:hypothetical protein
VKLNLGEEWWVLSRGVVISGLSKGTASGLLRELRMLLSLAGCSAFCLLQSERLCKPSIRIVTVSGVQGHSAAAVSAVSRACTSACDLRQSVRPSSPSQEEFAPFSLRP